MSKTIQYVVVPSYPAYRAGTDGSIQSRYPRHARRVSDGWHPVTEFLFQGPTSRRPGVHIRGKGPTPTSVLVAEAFHGPCPDGLWVLHRDGDPANNTPSNLYYGTPKQNSQDRDDHGRLWWRGENSWLSKYTEETIRAVRQFAADAVLPGRKNRRYGWITEAVNKFGVSRTHVKSIASGRAWNHLND